MKKLIVLVIAIATATSLQAQSEIADSTLIKEAVLNYIENFFENDFDAMNESLHPRLAKRGLNQDGLTISQDFPPDKLKELMASKQKLSLNDQKNTVKDISVYDNMASASLFTGYPRVRWVELIHLVKQEGKWKIINVFWEFI
ncbi:MAG: nuclear transport factor 2 family protein [Bacteroidota bacterium]